MNVYTIPHDGQYIIYRPLLRLAFIGNQAMVSRVAAIAQGRKLSECDLLSDWFRFLDAIGFLLPDPEFTQPLKESYTPTTAVLCMTNQCNLRCVYCYADSGTKQKQELPKQIAHSAIDRCCKNAQSLSEPHFSVCFHGGGEPSLPFQKMKNLVRIARQKELPAIIELSSNGIWTKDKSDWLIENIDNISISFDGLPTVQNKQRPYANGENSFDVVMSTLHRLDAAKKNYGIRITVTDSSIHTLPESIALLCAETGCQTFQVEPSFNVGRASKEDQALSKNKDFTKAFMEAYSVSMSQGRHLYYSGARPWTITSSFCQAHEKAMVVTPEGKITSCYEVCSDDHPLASTFHLGHIDNETGEIELNPKKLDAYLQLIENRKLNCRKCFCYWHCAGDCPAKSLLPNSNKVDRLSLRCDLNRKILKELIIFQMSNSSSLIPENTDTVCL